MQSDKKFKRDPTPKMLAHEFAMPYAQNVEGIRRAISNADRYILICKEVALHKTDKLEKKHYTNVANFWMNVKGILEKNQKAQREGKK